MYISAIAGHSMDAPYVTDSYRYTININKHAYTVLPRLPPPPPTAKCSIQTRIHAKLIPPLNRPPHLGYRHFLSCPNVPFCPRKTPRCYHQSYTGCGRSIIVWAGVTSDVSQFSKSKHCCALSEFLLKPRHRPNMANSAPDWSKYIVVLYQHCHTI